MQLDVIGNILGVRNTAVLQAGMLGQVDKYYTLNTHWYDGNSVNSIADAIRDMQDNSAAYRQQLPDRCTLDQNAYENKKDEIEKTLQGIWI